MYDPFCRVKPIEIDTMLVIAYKRSSNRFYVGPVKLDQFPNLISRLNRKNAKHAQIEFFSTANKNCFLTLTDAMDFSMSLQKDVNPVVIYMGGQSNVIATPI